MPVDRNEFYVSGLDAAFGLKLGRLTGIQDIKSTNTLFFEYLNFIFRKNIVIGRECKISHTQHGYNSTNNSFFSSAYIVNKQTNNSQKQVEAANLVDYTQFVLFFFFERKILAALKIL